MTQAQILKAEIEFIKSGESILGNDEERIGMFEREIAEIDSMIEDEGCVI